MGLISGKCPECGASLKISEKATGQLTCPYCGSEYLVEHALTNIVNNVTNNVVNNTNIDTAKININLNNDFEIESGVIKKYKGKSVNVVIPPTVREIADSAFSYAKIETIKIPNSVTSIGSYAFIGCSNLTSITLGNSVTSIGKDAFYGCTKLIGIINLSSLVITKGSRDNGYVGYYALNIKTSGETDIVNVNDYLFYTYEGVNYLLGYVGNDIELVLPNDYGGKTYEIYDCAFYESSSLTSITIPDSVTSIGRHAFYRCCSLESITIGNIVTSIGYCAFSGCSSLTSITIPNSVTSIGSYAFRYCSSLTSITIPDSVTSIGEGAFFDCSKLTSITIPDGVTSIGENEFSECRSLKRITIGNSVTSIGHWAFYNCESLTSINFKGTKSEWNAISKDREWNTDTGSYTIHCTDGEIAKS